MTDREIMQQALDALNNHNGNYKLTVAECNAINKVCDNLRQALAQPEQKRCKCTDQFWCATFERCKRNDTL